MPFLPAGLSIESRQDVALEGLLWSGDIDAVISPTLSPDRRELTAEMLTVAAELIGVRRDWYSCRRGRVRR